MAHKRLMKIGRMVLISLFAFILSTMGCAKRSVEGSAQVVELKMPGDHLDCLLADFDGDSSQEVFALSMERASSNTGQEPLSRRKGTIISFGSGGFSDSQSVSFDLPSDAVVFDVGDADGDTHPEILYLAEDGLYSMKIQNQTISKPLKVFSQSTIFALPTGETAAYWDIYRTSHSPHRPLILVPCLQGISIYTTENGAADSVTTLQFVPDAAASSGMVSEMREANRLVYSCTLPTTYVADYEGDGVDDIFIVGRDEVLIYPGTLSGGFAERPTVTFGKELAPADTSRDSSSDLSFQVADLNNDGRADIVVTKGGGGITHYQSEVSVYFGNSNGGYDARPSYVRKVSKSAGTAYLNDFDGDGRIDLAIPAMELGVTALLKMLVLNRLDMNIEIYLQQVGSQYPDEPSLKKSISSQVDLGAGSISYGENMAFSGDYNGDQLKDFLFENGSGELQVFFGAPATVLSSDIGWSAKIPHPCCLMASDLDHDGRSEILAFYPAGSKDANIIRVIRAPQGKMTQ